MAVLKWPTWAQITEFRGQGGGCSALALLGEIPADSLHLILTDLNRNWRNAKNHAILPKENVCSGWCAGPFPEAVLLSDSYCISWGYDPTFAVIPRPSACNQPTFSWSRAPLRSSWQDLEGAKYPSYGVMGQEPTTGCALYFWGLRRVRGLTKINIFNSTEWNNKLKWCWNPVLGFYNPQKLVNFRDLCELGGQKWAFHSIPKTERI